MKNVLVAFFILLSFCATAQNKFTQYTSAPIFLNPANTGLINGTWRAAANYSNEWNSVTVPYITTAISYDMNLFKKKFKKSYVGIGILRTDRLAGDGNEEIERTGISLAYHKVLNDKKERPSTISLGLNTSYVQEQGYIHGFWGIISGEYIINPYLDYQMGVMFSGYLNSRFSFYSGFSVSHLTKPTESILNEIIQIQPDLSVNVGGVYSLSKRWVLNFSSQYQQQGLAYDVTLGAFVGYNLNLQKKDKRIMAYLGAWYKYDDIFAPYFGIESKRIRFGLSSDLGIQSLTEAMPRNSFELSLIFTGGKKMPLGGKLRTPFPRF